MARPEHHWTKPEDIVAFFLSRYGDRSFLGIGTATIVRLLNERPMPNESHFVPMTLGSLSYRIGNFNYLDRRPGWPDRKPLWRNYAKLSRGVYEEYKDTSIIELRSLVLQTLGITVKDSEDRAFQEFCNRFLKPKILKK